MKKIAGKVVLERTQYIAEDGTVFNSPNDCWYYEMGMSIEEAEKIVEKLAVIATGPPFADDGYDWRFYRVENEKQLLALCITLFDPDNVAFDYRPPVFPVWVQAYANEGCGGIAGTLEEVEAEFAAYIAEAREEMRQKEKVDSNE